MTPVLAVVGNLFVFFLMLIPLLMLAGTIIGIVVLVCKLFKPDKKKEDEDTKHPH